MEAPDGGAGLVQATQLNERLDTVEVALRGEVRGGKALLVFPREDERSRRRHLGGLSQRA